MGNKRSHPLLLAVFAAIALLAVETFALAHEIEHDLEQHDEPSCPLHLFVTNFAKAVGGDVGFVPAPVPESFDVTPAIATPRAVLLLGYRGRAPPRHIDVIA